MSKLAGMVLVYQDAARVVTAWSAKRLSVISNMLTISESIAVHVMQTRLHHVAPKMVWISDVLTIQLLVAHRGGH